MRDGLVVGASQFPLSRWRIQTFYGCHSIYAQARECGLGRAPGMRLVPLRVLFGLRSLL